MSKWQHAFHQPNIPQSINNMPITSCNEHIMLSKKAAREGMVLLKNDHSLLPLSPNAKLALFGKGTFDYVKGGGGSGDVTSLYTKNIYDGITKLGLNIAPHKELCNFYMTYVIEQYEMKKAIGTLDEPALPDEFYKCAREYTDTAIITISRFSKEDSDRTTDDYYLSSTEKAMVDNVKKLFNHIIVVLNVDSAIDTEWFAHDDKIQSVLLSWLGGMEGGSAIAELLFGLDNPSGKLADTFAKSLDAYPSTASFYESDDYVNYTEDIYVGYRYFETMPEAIGKVNYPFGYGLSYTTFKWTVDSVKLEHTDISDNITVTVDVVNTGKRAGKEVIQLYASAPRGFLGKPAISLVSFQKTKLLAPGETERLVLAFTIDDLASYDDSGKIEKSAYILEAGDYRFYIGNSSRNLERIKHGYTLQEHKVICSMSTKLSKTPVDNVLLTSCNHKQEPQITFNNTDKYTLEDVHSHKISTDDFLSQLSDEDLISLLGGQPNVGVADTGGIGNLPMFDIPNLMTADGPAGLRILPKHNIRTTAFPCATLLACTWNPALLFSVGKAAALEVKENNIKMLLAPAVNIHRNPLCRRNFEYFSEDPLLTGILASAMVIGIQSQGISACVKHFALNNKETNRLHSDSRISERAAREIYLRPFEIIIKKATPWCIMTSYNLINSVRVSENKELITDILRGEWGYTGLVITDWYTAGTHYKELLAGNDVKMPLGYPDELLEALDKGLISRTDMIRSVGRILEFILKIN